MNENKLFNGLPDTIEEALKYADDLGTPKTYNHYPTGWAWAFNTPFKMWKRYASYQGGTADPLIVSWPAQIKEAGIRRQYTHAVDVVPTIYELLGVELPEAVKGFTQYPLEGESFAASLHDADAKGKQTQFYSMLGTRGIYHDGWKAAPVTPAAPNAWGDFAGQRWELFNVEADPSECHDLAEEQPEKLQELIALWWAEAGKYGALPLESRDAIGILLAPRPQLSKPRDRYVYYPDCAEVPESVTPNIRNRSYAIGVELRIDTPEASGVLFSQGARFGGHALYLKGGKFKYVYNWVGEFEQIVESSSPIPVGEHVLSASFVKEGDGMPTEGTLTLYVDDEQGRRGEDQDPARQVLAGRRGPERREGGRRARHRRLSGKLAVGVRRRDDPPGDRRRRGRAVGRSGVGGRGRVRARLTSLAAAGAAGPRPPAQAVSAISTSSAARRRDPGLREGELNLVARAVDPPLDRGAAGRRAPPRSRCTRDRPRRAAPAPSSGRRSAARPRSRARGSARTARPAARNGRCQLGNELDGLQTVLPRPDVVEHDVLRDLEDPGAELRAKRVLRQRPPGADEHLLCQVLGELTVADRAQHVVEDGQVVRPHDRPRTRLRHHAGPS